jgi:hypothetical protein
LPAVDRKGNLIIVDHEKDWLLDYAALQSLRYAATVSTMTGEQP